MSDNVKFIFNTTEYLSKKAVSKFNIPIIPKGSVLLSFKLTVGRIGIAAEDIVSNEAIACFKTNNVRLRNHLIFFLKNYDFNSIGSTSSIATAVNSKIIKQIVISIPNDNELDIFNNIAEPVINLIFNFEKEVILLTNLKKLYLQKFFG